MPNAKRCHLNRSHFFLLDLEYQTKKQKIIEFTFYVEATAVLVPAFQANLVAQDGEETFKLFTTSLCYEMKIDDCIK